jgi:hypothetical protein
LLEKAGGAPYRLTDAFQCRRDNRLVDQVLVERRTNRGYIRRRTKLGDLEVGMVIVKNRP